MKSKAKIMRSVLSRKRLLDIGGAGFGADNAWARDLRGAWRTRRMHVVSARDVDRIIETSCTGMAMPA